jgi:NAD(P)-dependent dehydrogenase (short-subunit alcohol dehydrogenase family)
VALELASSKITCDCISPGYVWTPPVEKQLSDMMKARSMSRGRVINAVLLAAQPTMASQGRVRDHFPTRLHLLRSSGRKAWSGGIVATSLTKSHGRLDSSGALTWTK